MKNISIHGDVADLGSSCRVSLSGLDLDRLPPHYIYILFRHLRYLSPISISCSGTLDIYFLSLYRVRELRYLSPISILCSGT